LVAAYYAVGNTTESKNELDRFYAEFPKFQFSDISENEKRALSPSPFVKNGRDAFHKNITDAWNANPPKP
jgi:hypothetical protein